MRFGPLPLLAVSLLGALLGACAPRAGGGCRGAQTECIDRGRALVCRDGRFKDASCGGKLGCRDDAAGDICDTTTAIEGATCADDGYACSADGRSSLRCTNGRMTPHLGCRGPKGCSIVGSVLSCDASIARTAEACAKAETYACGETKKDVLVCNARGTWAVHRLCRGPAGCNVEKDAPICDESIAASGDPCGVVGHLACSVDGKAELVCQNGQFSTARACKKACQILSPAGGIRCE